MAAPARLMHVRPTHLLRLCDVVYGCMWLTFSVIVDVVAVFPERLGKVSGEYTSIHNS